MLKFENMRRITLLNQLFLFPRPLSWLVAFGIGGSLCALAVASALVKPATLLLPETAQRPEAIRHYFAPERLEAFSGNAFNLKPDLVVFLDQLEGSLQAANQTVAGENRLFATHTQFVNPDYVTFDIYTIQLGDNYWKLAKERGYTIDSIVGCNPQLKKVICYAGQRILMPSRGGSLHHVSLNETLSTIALDYAVLSEEIMNANFIDPHWGVMPGMYLFIPGAKPRYLSEEMHKHYSKRALFRSPLAGRYTSFVGVRTHPVLGFSKFHNGVDIACPHNTWVGASAAGTVLVAGWGGAVGKYIKIDHHNGYKTLYGHLSKIHVRSGQRVKRGQLIGRSGATGRVTAPHLHFTIWEKGRVKDPMDYLW